MSTVQDAVQNILTNSKGEPLLSVDNTPQWAEIVNKELDEDLLKASYELADRAYDIQWGKDGIQEVKDKLNTLMNSVGEIVYSIAKMAYEHCKSVPHGYGLMVAKQYFLEVCKADEEHILHRDIELNGREIGMTKLIPTWPQYKSVIAKGMEMGIDPMARNPKTITTKSPEGSLLYPTVADYRKAVNEAEAKSRGANERDTSKPADRKEASTALSVVSSGWSPRLKAAMAVMCEQLSRLDHANQDKFADAITEIAGKAKTLADTIKRDAEGDTRTANQKAAQPLSPEDLAAKLKAERQEEGPTVDDATKTALQSAVGPATETAGTPTSTGTPEKARNGRKDRAKMA